jgi:hypothetical protein
MITPSPNMMELRRLGLEALVERLGASGAMQFLQQFTAGAGDYTRERRAWIDSLSLDDIARSIEQRRRSPSGGVP